MKHAISALEEARSRTLERLSEGENGSDALDEKSELDRAIKVLRAIGDTPLPEPFEVVALGSIDFGPFAEYRLLWDFESEQRSTWREIPLRLSPGDVVITSKEQFAESQARRPNEKKA